MIIENSEVADIWLRVNAEEELTAVDAERYRRLVAELLWIEIQAFDQWTRVDGEPADWVVSQLVRIAEEDSGLKKQIGQELRERSAAGTGMALRLKTLYPDFY